jgi:competence protein ComEC
MRRSGALPLFLPASATACVLLLVLAAATAGCTGIAAPAVTTPPPAGSGELRVYFLDVGQGDAELILFNNKTILIDAGETDRGDRVVADLKKLGVMRIDLLVATHAHSDHIGGMEAVLAAFPVSRVLDAGVPSSSSLYGQFLTGIDNRGIPYTVAEQGQTIDLDPALPILVLSPPEKRLNDDANENSVVLRVSYGTVDFLFTGDLGGDAEDALAKSGYALDAEILKVGHHGSSSSTGKAFLARVHPETAVIETGADNPYGHPHASTLQRLAAAGATVYRTDTDGMVLVETNGASYTVTTEKSGADIRTIAATTAPAGTGTVTTAATIPTLPALPAVPAIADNGTLPAITLPPVQLGNASSVYISATQFDAPGDDRENLNGEWVRIANRGDGPVLIAGWTLTDATNTSPFVFPAVVLLPAGSVTVFTGSGAMNDTALYRGLSSPVWGNSGDVAILRDGAGTVIDRKPEGSS